MYLVEHLLISRVKAVEEYLGIKNEKNQKLLYDVQNIKKKKKKMTTRTRFELMRDKPIGIRSPRLNHSAIVPWDF